MPKTDRDNNLAIVATVLVLFSAMLNPVVTMILAAVCLFIAISARLIGHS